MPTGRTFKIYYLLAPLSLFYGIGVKIRNLLFDWGFLPSKEYPVPVISIGNLAVGGTGKTPHTEYVIRLLKKKYRPAVLSRGYKRQTGGYILADNKSTSRTIGDEPFQIKLKFPDVIVAVDSNRRRGIRNLLQLPAGERPDVIILDDAYQHRYVRPSFSILTTDYHRLFYKDMLLPAGRLRESKGGRKRANAVVVTKCPSDLQPIDFRIIEDRMELVSYQHIFFSHIIYDELEPVFRSYADTFTRRKITKEDNVLLIAGIASSGPFVEEVKRQAGVVTTMIFPDHHSFERQDLIKIKDTFDRIASLDKYILMTEKDAARMLDNPSVPEDLKSMLYYLPIRVGFISKPIIPLSDMIENHITSFKRNIILKQDGKKN